MKSMKKKEMVAREWRREEISKQEHKVKEEKAKKEENTKQGKEMNHACSDSFAESDSETERNTL